MLASTPLADRYEIGPALGQSALSTVWQARDRRTGAQVALKTVRPLSWMSGEEAEARCLHVARALEPFVGLRVPNLATVHGIAVSDGAVTIARDLVDGCSLGDLMANGYRLDPFQADHVAASVAEAMQGLDRAGLAHGAVNAGNVFIANDGTVRLTDAAFSPAASHVRVAGADCRLLADRRLAGDLEDLAFLALVATMGYCPPELQPALRSRYASVAVRRLHRPADPARRAQQPRPVDVLAALRALSRPEIFQVAWRPAAALGLFGVLLTMGGSALTDSASSRLHGAPSPHTSAVAVAVSPGMQISAEDSAMVRLAIRRQGPAALSHPVVADLMRLTETQREQIAACLAEQRSRVAVVVTAAADGTIQDTRQSMQSLREATQARVAAVLDESQQTLWQQLAGAALQPDEPVL